MLAVTASKSGHDECAPASAIADSFADHQSSGAPTVYPGSGSFNDATLVRIDPPLYFRSGSIHYTLDGSKPTAASPVYKKPFLINDPTTVKVAQVDPSGKVGEVGSAHLLVKDVTPASVTSANIAKSLGFGKVTFSEPVTKESAEDTSHYSLTGGFTVAVAS